MVNSNTSINWNTLTLGLYQDGTVGFSVQAVITERFTGSLNSIDNNIYIHRLDAYQFNVSIYDANILPVDVTTATFVFTVRERYYDRAGKILFTKSSPSGIVFIDSHGGVIGINFVSDDTIHAKSDIQYTYELEMYSGGTRQTIMNGDFIIRAS